MKVKAMWRVAAEAAYLCLRFQSFFVSIGIEWSNLKIWQHIYLFISLICLTTVPPRTVYFDLFDLPVHEILILHEFVQAMSNLLQIIWMTFNSIQLPTACTTARCMILRRICVIDLIVVDCATCRRHWKLPDWWMVRAPSMWHELQKLLFCLKV